MNDAFLQYFTVLKKISRHINLLTTCLICINCQQYAEVLLDVLILKIRSNCLY